MDYPKRKSPRLKEFDYSTPGYYFITICTKDKRKILSHIVDGGYINVGEGLRALPQAISDRPGISFIHKNISFIIPPPLTPRYIIVNQIAYNI